MTIEVSDEMAAKLAREAQDLEGTELSAGATPTRRGSPRSRVYSIRLNNSEVAELESIAAEQDLPPSTVARTYILAGIREVARNRATADTSSSAATHELAEHLREAAGILEKINAA